MTLASAARGSHRSRPARDAQTRWSAEAWSAVRVELKRALALRKSSVEDGFSLRSSVRFPSGSHACERQYQSRKRDNPHRLLHTRMDQIRKTIPDGLPTGV
jgi:hypothetical protein